MGKAVVFVTHKIKEAIEIADRITVLRRGEKVGTYEKPFEEGELLTAMFQGVVQRRVYKSYNPGDIICRAEGLRGIKVTDVNIELRRSEVVAVLGVAGNGQEELMELLSGFKKPQGGRIIINGEDVTGKPYTSA